MQAPPPSQRSVAGAYKQTSNPPFHRIHRVGIFLSIFYHYHHQHTDNDGGWDSAEESIGCVVSSIGNMGPGLGDTGPAYSWNALPDAAKWLLSFLMLLGRLELFTVLLLFTPEFWKRN